ncbi:hypothetical protein, partial [Actinoplanes rectilineatus]|uniref:hypothetical protein n=1 Tax=Actinoplanes rectilineatus TaxID=113571 RepID=UPI001B806675
MKDRVAPFQVAVALRAVVAPGLRGGSIQVGVKVAVLEGSLAPTVFVLARTSTANGVVVGFGFTTVIAAVTGEAPGADAGVTEVQVV